MKRVGFLGCGKIGQAMLQDIDKGKYAQVAFIQDPDFKDEQDQYRVVLSADEKLLKASNLVVEAATADVLQSNALKILEHCDLMCFSVTSFADSSFYEAIKRQTEIYNHKVYFPHGAILGVDGILDGREILQSVKIVTTKNPKSLGRNDTEKKVVYEGSTKGACGAYPRNVNVHATIALAGLGFDKTESVIVSDPSVNTNSHIIYVKGDGIDFEIHVSSQANGKVTGKYTPYSAISSLRKVLEGTERFQFV